MRGRCGTTRVPVGGSGRGMGLPTGEMAMKA